MSINTSAIAYFGIYFRDYKALEKFLEEHDLEIEDELSEDSLGCSPLNCMTGEGYILGYKMILGHTIDKYKKQWDQQLGHLNLNPKAELDVMTF